MLCIYTYYIIMCSSSNDRHCGAHKLIFPRLSVIKTAESRVADGPVVKARNDRINRVKEEEEAKSKRAKTRHALAESAASVPAVRVRVRRISTDVRAATFG